MLGLVFGSDGSVRDARIVRSSGVSGLDEVARQGALRWRMNPANVRASDMAQGRQHLIKFYQNAKVQRHVEPFSAYWREL